MAEPALDYNSFNVDPAYTTSGADYLYDTVGAGMPATYDQYSGVSVGADYPSYTPDTGITFDDFMDAAGNITQKGMAFLNTPAGKQLLQGGVGALTNYFTNQATNQGNTNALNNINTTATANQAALQPYTTAGTNALGTLQGMAAQPTPSFSYNPNDYYNSPVYQNLQRAGNESVAAQSSANGMYGSGNMANALMERAQQIGAQYMPLDQQMQQQNYMNELGAQAIDYSRQAGLASTGLNALGQQTSLGTNAANAASSLYQNIGNANALADKNYGQIASNQLRTI